jgi:ADP-heptose:LPS heptosyltransferase
MSSFIRLGPGGVLEHGSSNRMTSFTPARADLNPPKRLARIQELLKSNSPKIAVVRGEGIGDVIMTLPAIKALANHFGRRVKITYATNTKYAEGALPKILKYNPDINEVIDRDSIDEAEFDTVLSLHCPAIGYEKFGNPPINRIDLFARHLGFETLAEPTPRIFLTQTEMDEGSAFLYRTGLWGKKVVMVQLFGTSPARSMAYHAVKAALIKLYEEYKINALIMTHGTDPSNNIIWNEIPGSVVVKGKDCREIASIMIHCDLVLCPDSALLHIAGALGVPTVTLFGPTDPRARINYYPNAVSLWGGENLGGHPHWYEKCPYGDLCWKLITDEAIVEACASHISRTRKVNPELLLKPQTNTITTEML